MSMYGAHTFMVRSAYDGTRVEHSLECGEGRTKQSHKDECDINNILRRYVKTGLLTPVNSRPAAFMDVSEVGDYRQALENVRAADAYFQKLGSKIRAEFQNDPALFLDFVSDPSNEDRARELGLLPPLEAPAMPEEAVPSSGGDSG